MGIDPQTSSSDRLDEIHPHHSPFTIILPRTEIPKRLKLNHESDGNVISFWVGRKFPNNFFVRFSFGPLKYPWKSYRSVYLSINGCEIEQLFSTPAYELSDHLWIVSFSNERLQNQLNKSKPSERNYVQVICERWRWDEDPRGWNKCVEMDWIKNHPSGGWGVGVECICQWASNNGSQTSMPTTNLCRSTPRTLHVFAQKASKKLFPTKVNFSWLRLRRKTLLRMASNPIPTLKTDFSPIRLECNAHVQVLLFFFYYSLSLFGKPKKRKQTSFVCSVFCFVLYFFFFFFVGKLKSSEGNGRDRSQGFQSPIHLSYPPSKKARKS